MESDLLIGDTVVGESGIHCWVIELGEGDLLVDRGGEYFWVPIECVQKVIPVERELTIGLWVNKRWKYGWNGQIASEPDNDTVLVHWMYDHYPSKESVLNLVIKEVQPGFDHKLFNRNRSEY